jgi:hypothetical protein
VIWGVIWGVIFFGGGEDFGVSYSDKFCNINFKFL